VCAAVAGVVGATIAGAAVAGVAGALIVVGNAITPGRWFGAY
jgi:hypothetical protein